MRGSLRGTMLWQIAGFALYLLGIVLFLTAAIDVLIPGSSSGAAALTGVDVAVMVVSLGMIVAGRLLRWKVATEAGSGQFDSSLRGMIRRDPDQSKLEELGYHVPPESEEESANHADTDAHASVTCPECGVRNDREFTYCRDCSAKLSG